MDYSAGSIRFRYFDTEELHALMRSMPEFESHDRVERKLWLELHRELDYRYERAEGRELESQTPERP